MLQRLKKLINNFSKDTKIKHQLVIYTSACFLMIFLGFIFIIESYFKQLEYEISNASQDRIVANLDYAAANLQTINKEDIEEIILHELKSPEVEAIIFSYSYVNVQDKNVSGLVAKMNVGKTTEDIDFESVHFKSLNEDFKSIKKFNDRTGKTYAQIEIYFNKHSIRNLIQMSKFLTVILLFINFFLVIFITEKIVDKLLMTRVNKLQEALDEIFMKSEFGSIFLEINENDELGTIKKKINDIHAAMLIAINQKNKANDELEEKIHEIKLLQKQIIQAEKIAGLGAIVGGVAHELNSPLSSTTMVLDTLISNFKALTSRINSGEVVSEKKMKHFISFVNTGLEQAKDSNSKALNLIHEFKSAVSSQSNEEIANIKTEEFISEIVNLIKTTYPSNNIKLTFSIDEELKTLMIMRGCLFRVLTGIISNAYVHAFPNNAKGNISIEIKNIDDSYYSIDITDDGIGIPDENKDKIFDPFFTTSLNDTNQGLGLHLALTETVKNLKGTINVSSEEGKGSTFSLVLKKIN